MSSIYDYYTFLGENTLVIVLVSWVALFMLWEQFSGLLAGAGRDKREPYNIKPTIPVIGHIIGALRHKSRYFDVLRCVSSLQCFHGPA